jgi:uncharacterized protein (TIGR02246 family)
MTQIRCVSGVYFIVALCVSMAAPFMTASDADDQAAIETVLRDQREAWNHHNLERFMEGYWKSAELTFFSGGRESHGWQDALDHYRAAYASPGHDMGKLDFSNLRIEKLGPDTAFVRGEFHLSMPDGKTPHGLFTLIFRRFPGGWKIIHDHSCAAD